MNIECPKCRKPNDIGLAVIKCGSCDHDLSGFSFKVSKKKLISTTVALVLGATGFHQIDKRFLGGNRYPLAQEYAIVELCINGDSRLIGASVYTRKREVCLCAMEKSTNDMPHIYSEADAKEFMASFKVNAKNCI